MRSLCWTALPWLLAGCTVIGHERVPDWPNLEIVEHRVPHADMLARCARYARPGMVPLACAEFDLRAGRCLVWLSAEAPFAGTLARHERAHCRGYEHAGGSELRTILERHRAAGAQTAQK